MKSNMTNHLRIHWTAALRAAAAAVAAETADDYSNTPDVRRWAREIAQGAVTGTTLAPHQVSFVQALRSRLDCRTVEPLASHRQFEAAWGAAYADALARVGGV